MLDRHDDREVERLRGRRLHDRDGGATPEKAGDLLERTHRSRQPDALGGLGEQGIQPLEGDGEVRASFGRGDRVHLVDDDRLDPARVYRAAEVSIR